MQITPLCEVFGKCGGCKFQNIEYSAQVTIKKNDVYEMLDCAGIPVAKEEIKIFCKNEYYYRNRMDFVISTGGCGLREKGKFHKIVNFSKCHIATEKINELLKEANIWLKGINENEIFDIRRKTGVLRYCVIRAGIFTGDSVITFILNKDADKKKIDAIIEKIEIFADKLKATSVLYGFVRHNTDVSVTEEFNVIKGSEYIKEKLLNVDFYYHSQGFFQINLGITLDMLFYINDRLKDKYDLLLDMYGGVGTFGIFLSKYGKDVFIIDNNKYAEICAAKNIKENNKSNITFIREDILNIENLLPEIQGKKSVFIIDPPRAGLHKKAINFILKTLPHKIFYISCNPVKFIDDFKDMDKKYKLIDFALFDMFPQTPHVESIAELDLK